ncbi:MAG: hypothetical protein XD68_1349 [Synergistales bacterium 54_24]|nr:MAG: hypothetical protein XD68_1349 [Synergistales bacterium 54_24]
MRIGVENPRDAVFSYHAVQDVEIAEEAFRRFQPQGEDLPRCVVDGAVQGEHGAVAEPVEGRGVDLDHLPKPLLPLPAAVLLRSLVGERVFDPPFF